MDILLHFTEYHSTRSNPVLPGNIHKDYLYRNMPDKQHKMLTRWYGSLELAEFVEWQCLLGDPYHSTRQASTSITCRLAEFMPSFPKIINICMNLKRKTTTEYLYVYYALYIYIYIYIYMYILIN
jgi:hypothetical protein